MIEKPIKISCKSSILKNKSFQGVVWRQWGISVKPIQYNSHSSLSSFIDHVEYLLHESFETPHIVCYKEPFIVQQIGWGAFDLKVIFHFKGENIPPQTVMFDLNFAKANYSEYYTLYLPSDFAFKGHVKRTRESSISSVDSANGVPNKPHKKRAKHYSESSESSMTSSNILSDRQEQVYDGKLNQQIGSCNTFTRKQQTGSVVQNAWDDALLSKMDIKILGNSLEGLDDEQLRKVYDMFFQHDRRNMSIVETKDHVFIDLYTVGPLLLKKLWEFTRNIEMHH
ncbi:yeats family-domain-containing protein [Mucor mucedo]|uniref:yeats family-domain-containing protein n=1 Tax=Mucor mucedo TaxID=29922 RepID=UPI002220ACF5|nr:yeats family-domain-containing protein [Mucor mucedo]KAI7896781.1 yeats family-domain-containing protein [Mucor mucedo]